MKNFYVIWDETTEKLLYNFLNGAVFPLFRLESA